MSVQCFNTFSHNWGTECNCYNQEFLNSNISVPIVFATSLTKEKHLLISPLNDLRAICSVLCSVLERRVHIAWTHIHLVGSLCALLTPTDTDHFLHGICPKGVECLLFLKPIQNRLGWWEPNVHVITKPATTKLSPCNVYQIKQHCPLICVCCHPFLRMFA